jgi:hypothetical protein
MPIDGDGQCIPFTPTEITDMGIGTPGVRDQTHPTEARAPGESTMRRTFRVLWDSRYDFCELVLGNVSLWDDAGTIRLSRLLPDDTYGRHHTHPQIVATKIEKITGFRFSGALDDDGLPIYDFADVEVLYEHVPYQLLDDDDATTELDRYTIPPGLEEAPSEAEYTTMPGGILHYIRETGTDVPHLRPIPFNIGYVTPTQKRTFRWNKLPESLWGDTASPLYERVFAGEGADGRPFIGTVNKEELYGYPTGTLLFLSVKDRLYRDPLGSGWLWDLEYVFDYRPQGWNWMRYFDTETNPDGSPVNASANGVYFVGKGATHYYSDTLPDNYALYDARDHTLLWAVE